MQSLIGTLVEAVAHGAAAGLAVGSILAASNDRLLRLMEGQSDYVLCQSLHVLICAQIGAMVGIVLAIGLSPRS
jgi:hypothetical protein